MVEIIGLGPAGAALASLLGEADVAERSRRYYKACGEAVPVETPLIPKEFVVDKVRRFKFYLWDREIGEVSYEAPRWYIIDKGSWVEWLRGRARPAGERGGVVVDARGPYADLGGKVVVASAYFRGRRLEDEAAYFIYPRGLTGFFWAFPHGEVYNVGGGFLGVGNPIPPLRDFAERWLGGGELGAVRGAPLTVKPVVDLGGRGRFKIGEAAGLVYPLTGEGIRPAVLSAIALAEALRTKRPLEEYKRRMRGIAGQIKLQRRLLELAARAAASGASISALADDEVLRDYIEEDLSLRGLALSLAKRPGAAATLLRALLKR